MTEKGGAIPDDVLTQATAWLYRVEASPDDAALRDALQRWIASDERHARAWQLAVRAWTFTGKAKPAFADVWATDATGRGPARSRRRRTRVGAVAALAACLALAAALPDLRVWIRSDVTTGVGETRELTLDDGSVVQLGADSAIAADMRSSERAVALVHGEAFFRVVADRTRPFVVKAEDLTVTVTGTAFGVGMSARSLTVAVAAGAVDVSVAGRPAVALSPGYRLVVNRQTGAIERAAVSPVDVAAWRDGRMVVQDAFFDDVVDAIGRYHRGAIVIADASLGGRRVTGVYDLHEPVRALRALAGPYGSVVREVTPYLLVVTSY